MDKKGVFPQHSGNVRRSTYDKYPPTGEKIPAETYNLLTYLERVPWSAPEAARREFEATYNTGRPQRAPELAPVDVQAWLNTDPLTLQQLRGKVVLLDFWGTQCRPCVAALPDLQKLFRTHQDRGLIVLGITAGESEARIRAFLDNRHLTFPVAMARGSNLWHKYAIEGTPTYFLIDRAGHLVWGPAHGLPDEPQILALLRELRTE
ncbi:MAG: TlpA family protein disulfide reductase [Planctomycetes bacterium]|nr:TlpA family protein disulfide reductase [Planctomycetota bacterium]